MPPCPSRPQRGGELAEALPHADQGDPVFAAGVAGVLEHLQPAEEVHLIEQEQDAPGDLASGTIGGPQQRADDDAAELRRGSQRLHGDLDEHRQLAAGQLRRVERRRRTPCRHRPRSRAIACRRSRSSRCRRTSRSPHPSACRPSRGRDALFEPAWMSAKSAFIFFSGVQTRSRKARSVLRPAGCRDPRADRRGGRSAAPCREF